MEHRSKRQKCGPSSEKTVDVARFLDLEAQDEDDDEEEWDELDTEQFFMSDEAVDELEVRPFDFTRLYAGASYDAAETEERETRAALERWKQSREEARAVAARMTSITDVEAAGDFVYWMVHCRRKSEASTAQSLNTVLPDGLTAFALDGLLGRVYIAAPQVLAQADILIRRFGFQVPTAYVHRRIKPLCETDRRMLVRHTERRTDYSIVFPIGSWVRIKHGQYNGDVARVFKTSSSSDEMELLVVPRFSKESTSPDAHDIDDNIDPQGLYDVSLLPEDTPLGPFDGSFLVGDDVFLRNGLRVITVQGSHYATRHPNPKPEDIWFFTLAGIDTRLETNKAFLMEGDHVRDLRVQYDGEQGVVTRVDATEAVADVDSGDDETHPIHMSYLERFFEIGKSVIIRLGPWKGRSGMVVEEFDVEITLVEVDGNMTELSVHKSSVQSTTLDERMQIMSTPATLMQRTMQEPRKTHPAMHKLVYIIPLQCFGRVNGIENYGAAFLVHHGRKTSWRSFKPSELVATDIWLKLDTTKFEGVEAAQQLLKSHVDRVPPPVLRLNRGCVIDAKEEEKKKKKKKDDVLYMDTLSTNRHFVFVSDTGLKQFGYFVGSNGKGSALVTFDRTNVISPFRPEGVISLCTGRRLDGQMAGNLRLLRARCNALLGPDPRIDPKFMRKVWRRRIQCQVSTTGQTPVPQNRTVKQLPILERYIVDATDPCTFVVRKDFPQSVFREYYVLFRFRAGCERPKGVDGKFAWTSPAPGVETRLNSEVKLTYKSQDGRRFLTEFIPISSLELCAPHMNKTDEKGLIVKGEGAGTIVYPVRCAKDGKTKTGFFCRTSQSAGKKSELVYATDLITRIRHMNLGPPSN